MGEVIEFETGATRSDDTDRLDYEGFLSPSALELFAEYMHKHRRQADGKLRESDNWQKGMPISRYRKSLTRHFFELWATRRAEFKCCSEQDEYIDTLSALLFNIQGLLHEAAKGHFTNEDQAATAAPQPRSMAQEMDAAEDDDDDAFERRAEAQKQAWQPPAREFMEEFMDVFNQGGNTQADGFFDSFDSFVSDNIAGAKRQ